MRRFIVLLTLIGSLAFPATALAYNPLSAACRAGNGASSSTACSANGSDPISGPNGALKKVSLIIATIAGIVAVIIILVAGLEYIMSGGDPQKTASARSAIIGAAVGIGIIVASEGILLFVIRQV